MGYQNNKIEKLKRCIQGKFDVYIDVSNFIGSLSYMQVKATSVPSSLKEYPLSHLYWDVDYRKLKNTFSSIDGFNAIYFYTPEFDEVNDRHKRFRSFLKNELGFIIVSKPLKKYEDGTQKANFDVEIALDMRNHIDNYTTAVLFSGDSDFAYLVKFLRQQEKTIIGFSHRTSISRELPPLLSYYFDIIMFRNIFLHLKLRGLNAQRPPQL